MNRSLAHALFKRIRCSDPPGCCTTFVEHPYPPYRKRTAVTVGITVEHRFAFFYWMKCKKELMCDRRTHTRWTDDKFQPPDLISWDWHDDYDGDSGYIEDELKRLNQRDENEVALFSWAGLQPNNDGQIGPALWLNALGNVYIVQKQHKDCKSQNHVLKDRYGKPHHVYYFRSPERLPNTFYKTNSQSGVIWDIDLDFFTQEKPMPDQPYTPMLTSREIRSLLSLRKEWMQLILRNLVAITIALEPEYTGGLSRSLELYRQWEKNLFSAPLFSEDCDWREACSRLQPE
jgi:hypothetical protein